jgi:hypothetical protein
MRYVIDCFVDGVWVQFNVGQSVHMMSLKNKRRKVASGKISGVGDVDKFHFKVIPEFCYKVDMTTAYLGDVKLTYPHEDGDQWLAKDVVGGCTLWNERNMRTI